MSKQLLKQKIINIYSEQIDKVCKPTKHDSNPDWFTEHVNKTFASAKNNLLINLSVELDRILNQSDDQSPKKNLLESAGTKETKDSTEIHY